MRFLAALILVLLTGPAAFAQGEPDCAKPTSEMTSEEYVSCVSLGGVKQQMETMPGTGGSRVRAGETPLGAGRGASAAASTRNDACARAKARAGANARGSCQCSQKSARAGNARSPRRQATPNKLRRMLHPPRLLSADLAGTSRLPHTESSSAW